MKKGQELSLKIERMKYPNVGIGQFEGQDIRVKNGIKGQMLLCRVSKKRGGKIEARALEVTDRADIEQESFCEHFNNCGGCMLQTLNYQNQLMLKREMVENLFHEAGYPVQMDQVVESPKAFEYRNKMEFSFGDAFKDGPLTLGMHKKGHHHDVVDVPFCHLVDQDFRTIQVAVLEHAKTMGLRKYNKRLNEGFLRHLVVRKGHATGEIMVALSATTQAADSEGNVFNGEAFVSMLKNLDLMGTLSSVLYVKNDGLGDVVSGELVCLYGKDHIMEKLFDKMFKINLYAFFQTNTLGAERLYQTAMELIPNLEGKICFDLFSGTGTIGQIMAQKAKQVVGIELIADAVDAARENAALNGLDNCTFICGDVFDKLSTIDVQPDVIVVDPPRSGMGEKTTKAVAAYGVPEIVYISCNPSTLLEDLMVFSKQGYACEDITIVDMFPWTAGVESIVKLQKKSM